MQVAPPSENGPRATAGHVYEPRRRSWRRLAAALVISVSALTLAAPAAAQDETARAEYVRLSREIGRLAERNAWSGVERTWQAILETGIQPSQSDLIVAAQAAKTRGDVRAVRERLSAAAELGENREVLDWLWEIDSNYGRVELAADPGAMGLEPETMPFAPDLAAAVRFAQEQIAQTGQFDGYLPAGNYTFGTYEIRVMPRVQTVRIDARGSVPEPPREERQRRDREAEAAPEAAPPTVVEDRRGRGPIDPPPPSTRAPRTSSADPVTVGLVAGVGNRYGGIAGGGVNALLRIPVGGIGVGLAAGVGYDVEFGTPGYSAAGRLYLPTIETGGATNLAFYLGGGYSPLIWWRNVDGVQLVSHGAHGTLGLDLRAGKLVLDVSGEIGQAFAANKWRWAPGFGIGLGVALP